MSEVSTSAAKAPAPKTASTGTPAAAKPAASTGAPAPAAKIPLGPVSALSLRRDSRAAPMSRAALMDVDAGDAPGEVEAEPEAEVAEPEAAPSESTETSEPELEVAPEESEGEEAAPESPFPADIHGVPLAEVIEALQNGQLPDALWDVIQDELVDGEEREIRPLRDFRDGAMMHKNYTKKSMALAERGRALDIREQEFQAGKQEFHNYVRSWKDPKNFIRAAKALELPLEAVAIQWAEEYETRQNLPPEARAALEAADKREVELERKARELRAQERQMRQAQAQAQTSNAQKEGDAYVKFIQGHMPSAFEAAGLVETPETKGLIFARFKDALEVFWPDPKTPPSKEMVFRAAKATAELLGVKPGSRSAASASPARQQVAARQAPSEKPAPKPAPGPKALAGATRYDSGKTSSPARQTVTARGFMKAQKQGLQGRR